MAAIGLCIAAFSLLGARSSTSLRFSTASCEPDRQNLAQLAERQPGLLEPPSALALLGRQLETRTAAQLAAWRLPGAAVFVLPPHAEGERHAARAALDVDARREPVPPATVKAYRNALDGYLVPRFASTRLDGIRPRDVSAFVTDAMTRPQGKYERPWAASS